MYMRMVTQVAHASPPTPMTSESLRRSQKLSSGSGAFWDAREGFLGASQGPLGGSLGALGGFLGASWGPLGALLGRSWGALGSLRGALGAILEEIYQRRGEPQLAPPLQSPSNRIKRPKSFKNLRKINVLCFLAFSLLELSWAILDVPTTRDRPRPGQWGGVRGGVNPSPKGKKGVGRGNALDHLRPKGLVGFLP